MTMTVCFIFRDIIFMHLRCVQGQSMFQKLLFDSQRLLLLGQHFNTVSVLHLKVAMKPCVNLHMHNIMLMVRASCVLQVHVLVTFMSSSERAVLCGNNPETTTQPQASHIYLRKDTTNTELPFIYTALTSKEAFPISFHP